MFFLYSESLIEQKQEKRYINKGRLGHFRGCQGGGGSAPVEAFDPPAAARRRVSFGQRRVAYAPLVMDEQGPPVTTNQLRVAVPTRVAVPGNPSRESETAQSILDFSEGSYVSILLLT